MSEDEMITQLWAIPLARAANALERIATAQERIAKAQERLTMIGVLENCSSMERAQEALDHLDSLIA